MTGTDHVHVGQAYFNHMLIQTIQQPLSLE